MSFKTLEDRFNEKVNDIYAAAQLKFEGGLPSTGRFDDPLLTRRPGDGQFGLKQEGRSLPFASAPRDLKRITLFTLSPGGLLFLAKQQFLQTGNTFAHTRLINPAFVVGNTIPFLHLKRNLRVTSELFGKTDTSTENLRKMGYLQEETYDSFDTRYTNQATSLLRRAAERLFSPVTNTLSAFTAKRSIYEEEWKLSRPELKYSSELLKKNVTFRAGGRVDTTDIETGPYDPFKGNKYGFFDRDGINSDPTSYILRSIKDYDPTLLRWKYQGDISRDLYIPSSETNSDVVRSEQLTDQGKDNPIQNLVNELNKNTRITSDADGSALEVSRGKTAFRGTTNQYFEEETANSPKGEVREQPFLKYFSAGNAAITDRDSSNASDVANSARINSVGERRSTRVSYIKEPLNVENQTENNRLLQPYNKLPTVQEENRSNDPIIVSFAMGRDDHVQFRAFLTNLKEDASPQYNEQQYIGRIEKFITYSGVQRSISFDLALIAFSQEELEVVWKRINYLTGMVFPYGFNKGIMQPNIIRLSIGNVYRDQPGYITSLSKDFNNPSESWDIDYEVPIGAVASISFNIIEKATKIASSPFYGINENSSPENGFRTSLTDTDPNATVN
jgi:hypothetical protein